MLHKQLKPICAAPLYSLTLGRDVICLNERNVIATIVDGIMKNNYKY